jgi:small subunit ribosomal protein S17
MITKKGMVVKISGSQTAKVEVNEYRTHPKYRKQYRVTKNFLTHDPKSEAKVGDEVVIEQCSPISKHKRFVLKEIVKTA